MQEVKSVSDLEHISHNYYDEKSQINYRLANDDTFLYLQLKTKNNYTVAKIVDMGLTIYFDPKGHQNKGIQINCPIDRLDRDHIILPPNNRLGVESMLDSITHEGIVSFPGSDEKQQLKLHEEGIEVAIELGTFGGIIYEIKVPFSFLDANSPDELNHLSIGVVSKRLHNPGNSLLGAISKRGETEGEFGNDAPVKFWFKADLIAE